MATIIEPSTGYNWDADGVYQIEKSDPVEGGVDGISNRQARQLAHRTRDLHARLVAVKTDLEAIEGGSLDVAYDTLLKLQDKLKAVETAINGDNGDTLIETLQEALGFINNHKTDIESLVATYVKKSVIADNLSTSNPGYVLSAQQGGELKKLIDALTEVVAGKETPEEAQQKTDEALAQAKAYTNYLSPYDYVVDSEESLASLWYNNSAINILFKKGEWVISDFVGVGSNARSITGEPGAIIKAAPGKNVSFEGNKTCSLTGIIFDFTEASSSARVVSRFTGVTNCVFKIGDMLGAMKNVRNISNCQFICHKKGTDAGVSPFFANGFWVGYVDNCSFEGGVVSNAYDLRNCTFKNTRVIKIRSAVNCKFLNSTIENSSRVVECEFYGYDGTSTTTSVISSCNGVQSCNIQSGRVYSSSYASPGGNTSAPCGPTAAGGFNFSDYTNLGDSKVPDKEGEW